MRCRARRLRVKGKWRYASGVPYATHFKGLAPLKGPHPGGPTRKLVTVVVPRNQFEMLDDWHDMFGLKGSGSNSVVIKDAFIPKDFVDESIFAATATAKARLSVVGRLDPDRRSVAPERVWSKAFRLVYCSLRQKF